MATAKAQTMATTTVVVFQIYYVLNCRSLKDSMVSVGLFSNKAVYIGIGSLLVLQALFIYAPFMQAIFSTYSLSAADLLLAVLAGAIILPVVGAEKLLHKRRSA